MGIKINLGSILKKLTSNIPQLISKAIGFLTNVDGINIGETNIDDAMAYGDAWTRLGECAIQYGNAIKRCISADSPGGVKLTLSESEDLFKKMKDIEKRLEHIGITVKNLVQSGDQADPAEEA